VVIGLGIVAVAAVGLTPVAGQAKQGCTLASLNGAYGARETGVIVNPDGSKLDLAIVGRVVFDGRGHFSGTDTVSFNGAIARNETSSGTYTMNADCTGSDTGTVKQTGLVFHEDFVLVDHGKQAFIISTDPGTVLTGTAIKQDTQDTQD
jgi:hypothetical protein